MTTQPTLAERVSFANELADVARNTSLRYFRQQLTVEQKTDASPVTIADRETERQLRALIGARFPNHGLYGEEYGQDEGDGHYLWVIDPIDGTKSFISGVPTFGSLVALLEAGKPILGIIEMPALGERWVGIEGQATLFNGAACAASGCRKLSEATLFATSPDMFIGVNKERFDALSQAVQLRRFGGDCYAYGLLAAGFIDLVVEANMEPYDYLALVAVVAGAGGVISDWAGAPLGLASDGSVVAAATAELHQQALEILADRS